MALYVPATNGSTPGVTTSTIPGTGVLPRAPTGRRTSMGAFLPCWPGLPSANMASPQRSEMGVTEFVAGLQPFMTSFSGSNSLMDGSTLDSLIAAALSRGPVARSPVPAYGGSEGGGNNGNRLSPVREFPVSPLSLGQVPARGSQSPVGSPLPTGLKPEVLRMLLSKPLKPFQNRPVTQTRPAERIHTASLREAADSVNAPPVTANRFSDPIKPVSRSCGNPSLPFKKRVPSNGNGSTTSAPREARREALNCSVEISSPSLLESKPYQSDSLDTNTSRGLGNTSTDTSSQSVSPERNRVENRIGSNLNRILEVARTPRGLHSAGRQQRVTASKPGVSGEDDLKGLGVNQECRLPDGGLSGNLERKVPDETAVLRAMLAARDRELEAVRRERDAVQLIACGTKSLLERKIEIIGALTEKLAVFEAQNETAGKPSESEEIALAALTDLHDGGVARTPAASLFVARKPRTPSVSKVARLQRTGSFSSPLGRLVLKSNFGPQEAPQSPFDAKLEAVADGRRTPQLPKEQSSDSARGIDNSDGQSDVLEALMALQGGVREASVSGGGSQSSGEARLPKRAEEVGREDCPGRAAWAALDGSGGICTGRKRKLEAAEELDRIGEEPGEVVASPILLRLPVSPFSRRSKAASPDAAADRADSSDSDRPISPASPSLQPTRPGTLQPGPHTVAIGSKLMPRVRARYTFHVNARGHRSTDKDTCRIVCTNHCPSGRNFFASLSAFTKCHGDGVGKSWRRKLVLIDGQDCLGGSLSRFLNALDEK